MLKNLSFIAFLSCVSTETLTTTSTTNRWRSMLPAHPSAGDAALYVSSLYGMAKLSRNEMEFIQMSSTNRHRKCYTSFIYSKSHLRTKFELAFIHNITLT